MACACTLSVPAGDFDDTPTHVNKYDLIEWLEEMRDRSDLHAIGGPFTVSGRNGARWALQETIECLRKTDLFGPATIDLSRGRAAHLNPADG